MLQSNLHNAIPKSHYEICNSFLDVTRSLSKFVENLKEKVGYCPDFLEFSQSLETNRVLSIATDDMSEKTMQANVMYHMYNMKLTGEKIYYITPQLAIELSNTDLNVDTSYLISPFPEIHVQIDPGLFYINDIKNNTQYPVVGFYVYVDPKEEEEKLLRILCAAMNNKKDTNTISGIEDSLFFFKLELKPGKLKDSLNTWLSYINSDEIKKENSLTHGDINVQHIDIFTKFLVNVLLYLTSKDPDIINQLPININNVIGKKKNPSKIKKASKKLSKYTQKTIMIVGSKTPIDNSEMSQIKSSGGIGSWSLTHKVRVSSHWRKQWYGSEKDGSRYSKLIKISEYEKGPDAAEYINKKRVVV